MRQIASGILGYDVPKNRTRFANLAAIRRRQSSNVTRWVERMQRPVGRGPRGLKNGSSASYEEAKLVAEETVARLLDEKTNTRI